MIQEILYTICLFIPSYITYRTKRAICSLFIGFSISIFCFISYNALSRSDLQILLLYIVFVLSLPFIVINIHYNSNTKPIIDKFLMRVEKHEMMDRKVKKCIKNNISPNELCTLILSYFDLPAVYRINDDWSCLNFIDYKFSMSNGYRYFEYHKYNYHVFTTWDSFIRSSDNCVTISDNYNYYRSVILNIIMSSPYESTIPWTHNLKCATNLSFEFNIIIHEVDYGSNAIYDILKSDEMHVKLFYRFFNDLIISLIVTEDDSSALVAWCSLCGQ